MGSFKYDNVRIGMNSRLDTLQAAILKVKFDAFKNYEVDDINKAASLYTKNLEGLVKTPVVPEGYYSSWAQYTITLKNRSKEMVCNHTLKNRVFQAWYITRIQCICKQHIKIWVILRTIFL